MKKIITFLIAASMIFTLCACTAASAAYTAEPEEPTPLPTPTPLNVTLYAGDDNEEFIVPVECEIDELTPQAIVDKLYELGVFSSAVTVKSCEKGTVNILKLDMDKNFAKQVKSMGTAGERIMIGSLVNSFIKAYGADGVTLTVDGEPLETSHFVYDRTMIFYAE